MQVSLQKSFLPLVILLRRACRRSTGGRPRTGGGCSRAFPLSRAWQCASSWATGHFSVLVVGTDRQKFAHDRVQLCGSQTWGVSQSPGEPRELLLGTPQESSSQAPRTPLSCLCESRSCWCCWETVFNGWGMLCRHPGMSATLDPVLAPSGAEWAGRAGTVTSAFGTQAVSMAPASSPGSAPVRKAGGAFSATRVSLPSPYRKPGFPRGR